MKEQDPLAPAIHLSFRVFSMRFRRVLIFSSLGGLRSCATQGTNVPVDITNDEMRGLLDENLLSPVHSSEMNSPLSGDPNQTWMDVVRKHHDKKFKKPLQKQQTIVDGGNWETIETTVLNDNGTIEHTDIEESCTERCWDCIEGMIFRILCCNKSFKTAEAYKNMSDVFTKVDHVASRLFPFTFMIINIAYWALYIYIL